MSKMVISELIKEIEESFSGDDKVLNFKITAKTLHSTKTITIGKKQVAHPPTR